MKKVMKSMKKVMRREEDRQRRVYRLAKTYQFLTR